MLLTIPFSCLPGLAQRAQAQPAPLLLPVRPAGRAVPPAEVVWRKTLWRLVDLREPANRPLFVPGHELGAALVAAAQGGELVPYRTDSVAVPWSGAAFTERLQPGGDEGGLPYTARQLAQLHLREDVVFDKRHGRLVHEFRAITLVVPAAESGRGVDWPVASFCYEEVMRFFRAHPTTAIWRTGGAASSPAETAPKAAADAARPVRPVRAPLNLAVAFDRCRYYGHFIKVSNPDDVDAFDLAAGDTGRLLALSHQTANWLNELEYRLWNP